MIKNIFIKYRGKPRSASKEHCTYSDAANIGILYNSIEFGAEVIRAIEEQLTADGKNVSKVGYSEKNTEDERFFEKKDISGTGLIKKNHLSFFIKQPFDFLISLDTSANINFKYVLALSKATCKVGFETEAYHDLLQMSLKVDQDKDLSVESLVKYLKMI